MPVNPLNTPYPFDPVGTAITNKIVGEQQIITTANYRDYHFVVPKFAPYYSESLVISIKTVTNEVKVLVEGIDYQCTHWYIAASRACAKSIYGSISLMNLQLAGVVTLEYQTIGGIWTIDEQAISQVLADRLHNPRITAWDVVAEQPATFPPIDHEWDLQDLVGATQLVESINRIETAIINSLMVGLPAHMRAENPHNITPTMIGTYTSAEIDQKLLDAGQPINPLLAQLNDLKAQVVSIEAAELLEYTNGQVDQMISGVMQAITDLDSNLSSRISNMGTIINNSTQVDDAITMAIVF